MIYLNLCQTITTFSLFSKHTKDIIIWPNDALNSCQQSLTIDNSIASANKMMFSYLLVDFVFEFLRLWIISKLFIGVIYWHFINNKETKKRDITETIFEQNQRTVQGWKHRYWIVNAKRQIRLYQWWMNVIWNLKATNMLLSSTFMN